MSKKCVVSFSSNGRELYNKGMLRLIKSCVDAKWDGDYLMRSFDGYVDKYEGVDILLGSYPITERGGACLPHSEIPFAFKLSIIQEAREKGYDIIVWCDSSITMDNDIAPVLEFAKEYGVAAFDNENFPLYQWLSDAAQERLGISNEELWSMPQIMACCIIFDFTNPVSEKIFEEWYERCFDGCSFHSGYGSRRRGFLETRWDQSCLSGILCKYKIPFMPYGRLVYEPHDVTKEYGDEIYFTNRQIN